MGNWIVENWFDTLSAIGIVGGLLFTAHSLRSETETRRIGNLLTLIQNHRELWKEVFRYPQLARVLDAAVDLEKQPITFAEETFVNMAIQHLVGAYQAMKSGLVIKQSGLRADVASFFTLPIPRVVWEQVKSFQNEDFLAFVEECVRGGRPL